MRDGVDLNDLADRWRHSPVTPSDSLTGGLGGPRPRPWTDNHRLSITISVTGDCVAHFASN